MPLVFGLSACVTPEPEAGTAPVVAACDASEYQTLLGQSETILSGMIFTSPVRVIHPNEAVTEDFLPDRLNIHVNGRGHITRLSCG